ncbi:MAG TPA: hypothetical protein VGL42_09880 [Opitutaceae bacterium]|jgi:hypothetical protein
MKTRFPVILASLALLALAGCDTVPSVQYPITYQVPIGNSTVTSAYGPQNLNVSGQQSVPAIPGQPLYFQIASPVNVTLYVFDQTGPGPGGPQLVQSVGSFWNQPVTPTGRNVEFVFSATQQGTGGTVQFTVSDHPIPSSMPVTPPVPPAPGPNAVSVTPTQ